MISAPRRGRTALGVAAGLAVLAGTVPLWTANGGHVDSVTHFLLAVAVILVTCQALAALARRAGQPPVLGEMVGGLLLGPTLLGALWPQGSAFLFAPPVLEGLDKAAQLGLVVFVFLLGCELRTDRIARKGVVGAAVVGGMALPYAAGVGIVLATGDLFAGPSTTSPVQTVVFVGLAMAVTALPVLARILADLGLERTGVGALSMSAAAIGDGLAWLILAFLLAGQGAGDQGWRIVLLATALVLVTALCVRPLLVALVRRLGSSQSLTVVLIAGAIGYAVLTQSIQLHPVVGAFLFGVAVPRDSPAVERIGRQLEGFTLIILMPLFFAGVGLKMSVGLLGANPVAWLVLAVVLVAAVATKVVGAGGAVRLAGLPADDALRFGFLMNCRGVTELVVLTIGYQAGLINQLAYTILVLVAITTTAATAPLVRWSLRRSPDPARDEPPRPARPVERADTAQD
ncbi:cation:proton antiporter [Actinosynnema sp. NPDC050436]|uniref:cation:proton antiporter n=1 Tax=Actinosynnema sp. NPDC050436 TaxID=3155659 RepID=UPI0033DE3D36